MPISELEKRKHLEIKHFKEKNGELPSYIEFTETELEQQLGRKIDFPIGLDYLYTFEMVPIKITKK